MKINNHYPMIDTVRSVETFRTPENLILKALTFVAVFLVAQMFMSGVMLVFVMPRLFEWASERMEATGGQLDSVEMMNKIQNLLADPQNTIIMLYAFGIGTIVTLLYCRIVEGRKLRTLGFQKKGAIVQYLIGLGVGILLFSLIVLFSVAVGGVKWEGYKGGSVTVLLTFLVGFIIQGMFEEVFCRGFIMSAVLRHHNVWWAIGINSVFFGLAHSMNTGFSVFALINVSLFGVMASLYMLRTDNLWGVCALHSIWNFAEGNFYGLPVSGINAGDTVFSTSLNQTSTLLNGGRFGIEASIGATVVLLAAIAVLLFVPLPFAVKDPPVKAETQA